MAGAPGVGPGAGAGAGGGGAAAGLKTYFKTPEGRYKLRYEKTHSAVLHYSHGGKTVSQVRVGSVLLLGDLRGLLQWMDAFGRLFITANRILIGMQHPFEANLRQ